MGGGKDRSMTNLDDNMRGIVGRDINKSVPWFLITSFLYYRQAVSVISDEAFDWLCKHMLDNWDTIKHPHKGFISVDDLRAGTGFALDWRNLPEMVFGAAEQMRKDAGI